MWGCDCVFVDKLWLRSQIVGACGFSHMSQPRVNCHKNTINQDGRAMRRDLRRSVRTHMELICLMASRVDVKAGCELSPGVQWSA